MSRPPSPRQLRSLRRTIRAQGVRLTTFDQFEAQIARQLEPPKFDNTLIWKGGYAYEHHLLR